MRRLIRAAYCVTLMTCGTTCAQAAEKPNILVMGEDADELGADTHIVAVARDTRVFDRVLEAITEELTQAGYNAYDERAVVPDAFKQTRAPADLIKAARAVRRPPIDAVVLFSTYVGARKLAYTTDVSVRITARLLDVRTGEKLGGAEVTSPKGWRAPVNCERECLVEAIGKNAKTLAGDLGATMARKLGTVTFPPSAPPSGANKLPSGYTLVFAGFTPDDITGVEEYLVAFKGYKLHRPVTASSRGTQYWYEIDSDSTRLNRNLRMMLDRLGAEGRITFSADDNTFTVEHTVSEKAH
jgi:hypothetical protein